MRKSTLALCATVLGSLVAGYASAGNAGQAIYAAHCSACHGNDGKGAMPGIPDFTLKGGVLSQSDTVLLQRIENGYQSPGSPMAMPPKGGDASLTDAQIKQVLAYLHSQFGA